MNEFEDWSREEIIELFMRWSIAFGGLKCKSPENAKALGKVQEACDMAAEGIRHGVWSIDEARKGAGMVLEFAWALGLMSLPISGKIPEA